LAKSIGTLNAKLGLKSQAFHFGMKNATRSIKRFGRDVKKIGRLIRVGIIGPLVALGGVTSLGLLIKQSMQLADETGKYADRLGIGVKELTGLGFAAKLTGTNTQVMNRALEKMIINLGRASADGGELEKKLQRIGLDIEKLKRMQAGAQFIAIADAMSKMSSKIERAAIASEIFGRSGARMLNLLEGSKGSIKDLIKEADLLGITLSRMEIKQIENANDMIERMKLLLTAVGLQLSRIVAPWISELGERLIAAANDGDTFKNKISKALEAAITRGALFLEILANIGAGFKISGIGLAIDFAKIEVWYRKFDTFVFDISAKFHGFGLKVIDTFREIATEIPRLLGLGADIAIAKISEKFSMLLSKSPKSILDKLGLTELGFLDVAVKLRKEQAALNKELDATVSGITGIWSVGNIAYAGLTKRSDEMGASLKLAEDTLKELENMLSEAMPDRWFKDGNGFADKMLAWMNKITKKWEDLARKQAAALEPKPFTPGGTSLSKKFEEEMKKMQKWLDRFEKQMTRTFTNLAMKGELTFKSIGAAFRDMILQMILTKAFSGISSGIMDFISPVLKPFYPGDISGSVSKPRSGVSNTYPVPSGGGGGVVIHQNNNFAENVPALARQEILAAAPMIKSSAVDAVNDASRRRGY